MPEPEPQHAGAGARRLGFVSAGATARRSRSAPYGGERGLGVSREFLDCQKVFVKNLSFVTREQGLKEFFAAAGEVQFAKVDMHKIAECSGAHAVSKGTGLVVFATEEEAQNAIVTLNGVELDGNKVATSSHMMQVEVRGRVRGGSIIRTMPREGTIRQLQEVVRHNMLVQPFDATWVIRMETGVKVRRIGKPFYQIIEI